MTWHFWKHMKCNMPVESLTHGVTFLSVFLHCKWPLGTWTDVYSYLEIVLLQGFGWCLLLSHPAHLATAWIKFLSCLLCLQFILSRLPAFAPNMAHESNWSPFLEITPLGITRGSTMGASLWINNSVLITRWRKNKCLLFWQMLVSFSLYRVCHH